MPSTEFFAPTSASRTHPGVTTQPASGSKGSFVAWAAFAVVAATGVDAVSSALQGLWFEASCCIVFDVAVVSVWQLFARRRAADQELALEASRDAARVLIETVERQRQAVERRDELIRLRAEAQRRHRAVRDIDLELVPLAAKIEAGAI